MKIPHFYLFVSLLCLSALACTIVTVTDSSAPSALANAPEILPTQTANALPTPADCLKVQSLPSGGGSLNLRAGPGTGYAVRDVLADGQTLTKRGEADGWYSVSLLKVDGSRIYGFVRADYVEACP